MSRFRATPAEKKGNVNPPHIPRPLGSFPCKRTSVVCQCPSRARNHSRWQRTEIANPGACGEHYFDINRSALWRGLAEVMKKAVGPRAAAAGAR